eukprot:5580089-Amphidinium_carterae.1
MQRVSHQQVRPSLGVGLVLDATFCLVSPPTGKNNNSFFPTAPEPSGLIARLCSQRCRSMGLPSHMLRIPSGLIALRKPSGLAAVQRDGLVL